MTSENKYKLEDGTLYKPGDTIKLEVREYHQSTHYLNRQIEVDKIIENFGSISNFEKGLSTNYSDATDEVKELIDKVSDFINDHDYDREEDCWTMSKGGYDVETEIVKEFTMGHKK
jgi:hypothetical protein